MAGQITQCPQCQTSFRVTDEQLNIAGGAVRCGSCLHIFNAAEHWQGNGSNPADTASDGDTEIEIVDQTEEIQTSPDDKLIFSDTRKETAIDQLFTQDQLLFPDAEDSSDNELLFSDEQGLENDTADDQVIDDAPEESHTIFEQGLSSSDEFTDSNDNTGFSESFLDLDDWDDEPDNVFKDLDELNEEAGGDEAWTNALLDDTTEHHIAEQPVETFTPADEEVGNTDQELDEFPDLLDSLDDSTEQALDPDLLNILGEANPYCSPSPEEDEFILGNEPMIAGERIADNKEALLANIEPEPVQIHGHKKTTGWRDWGKRAAIIAAIGLLGIQYVNFNFDRLARDKQYRPLFAQACSWLNCTLPALHDVTRIRSSNLIVRSHPSTNNALIIDTIITNRADFHQPFPLMTLTFTNLAGEVIAGRQFKPKDYLAGEMLGSKIMPAKQPIHIALEIVDPGQEALNYQLQFSPNTDS
jgi:predicted Zn finger-like uncharacterized protein